MVKRFDFLRQVASVFCIASGIGLAACDRPPVPAPDYRIQHPIAAREKIYNLFVPVSGRSAIARSSHRIRRFAAEYLRRGRGPILVSHGGGLTASRKNRSMIADVLVEAGVPKRMVFFQMRSEKNARMDTAELSFSGYSVIVPKCGDWSGQAGFDPDNRSHTNFGCAYQRNTGLILSNPGDLSVAGDPLERDTPSSDRVVRTYREGKQMGTEAPKLEQKEFSDVKAK